jgi:ATP synthase protein I
MNVDTPKPRTNRTTTNRTTTKAKPSVVFKLALLQFLVTLLVSVSVLLVYNQHQALSALYGGLIAAIANLFFAGRLFVTQADLQATQILRRFYRSVSMKALFTLTMFAICIIAIKVSILPFIIAYFAAAVIVNWFFLLMKGSH